LIGILWTSNQNSGWFDLEVKLPFLLFPLIAFRLGELIDTKKMAKVLLAFVSGCLVATIICISHACYMWFSASENYFYYTKLSVLMHPSYLSMYVLLAVTFCYCQDENHKN